MTNKESLLSQVNSTATKRIGDMNDLRAQLTQLVQGLTDYVYDNCLRYGGDKTYAYLEGTEAPLKNVIYRITGAAGTLTLGSTAVASGDLVLFDGTNWVLYQSNAAIRFGGEATYTALEAGVWEKNQLFEVTTAGTLTLGTLAVVKGDVVYFDGAAWKKIFHNEALIMGGSETSVNLEAQTAPTKNKVYKVSSIATSATVGSLTTAVGDLVYYTGSAWAFLHNLSDTA